MRAAESPNVVRDAVTAHLDEPVVLAVSGGRDSMCLLHGVRLAGPRSRVIVACYDHGTGPHGMESAALVRRGALDAGFEVVVERARTNPGTEAGWRRLRWGFLRRVARAAGASVLTAHHFDDHIETVLMRLLRGAGAWGLAGLRAASGRTPRVGRPFLELGREALAAHATEQGLAWIDDPSNATQAHFRNRVRSQIRPALERVRPQFASELDELSRQASVLRNRLFDLAAALELGRWGGLDWLSPAVLGVDGPGRRLLWSALLHRVGVVLDRRGYERLGALEGLAIGEEVQLSGRVSVSRSRRGIAVHQRIQWDAAPLASGRRWLVGPWLLRLGDEAPAAETQAAWSWPVAPGWGGVVRPWRPGDRWQGPGCGAPRLVTRFLAEAGVPASAREGWPVVEANGEIVWVPGTRRTSAARSSPGRVTRWLHCEYQHG